MKTMINLSEKMSKLYKRKHTNVPVAIAFFLNSSQLAKLKKSIPPMLMQ